MKRIGFLLLICVHNNFFSQSWCLPGATWRYEVNDMPYPNSKDGVIEYKYVGDTILAGDTAKIISGRFFGRFYTPTTNIQNYRVHYTREDNNVVYAYSSTAGVFDTVINFNASIGDKWLTPRNHCPDSCRLPMEVIDTGHTFIKGHSLKTITTTVTYDWKNGPSTFPITSVQRLYLQLVGSNDNEKEMFPFYCQPDTSAISHGDRTRFLCYEDNQFGLFKVTPGECPGTVGFKDFESGKSMRISPNPANDFITIETGTISEFVNVHLSDITGKTFGEQRCKSPCILNIKDLLPGIYFVSISQNTALKTTKKLVIVR